MNGGNAMKWKERRCGGFLLAVMAAAFGSITLRAGDLLPPGAPGPVMHTLEEIYQQETLSIQLANTILFPRTLSANSTSVEKGYYEATTLDAVDADLVSANIVAGATLFGVVGSAVAPTGSATGDQVLSGATFSRSGQAGLTGSMPNRGAVALTPGSTAQAIPQGYHDGTGVVTGDSDLVPANIVSGVNVFGVAGSAVQSTGNATVDQVLSGSTFSKLGSVGLTGAMPNRGAVSITPGTAGQTILQGYHNGAGAVAGDADLAAANIVSGVTLFDVAGTMVRAAGNATEGHVLAGATFSRTGAAGLTGTMPNRGAVSITPGAASQAIPQGYHSGAGNVLGDADLAAANIRAGTNLFGVVGTLVEATGNTADTSVLAGQTFSRTGAADRTGTMANRGAVAITPAATNQVIQQGYHNGSGAVVGDAGLVPANLRTNITIFGVTGTYDGQAIALRRTGQTTSQLPGDDGDLQRGLAWPSPRFIDHGDETVTDLLTGLMWVKTPIALPGNGTAAPWTNAVQLCESLVHAGHDDWHLPTVREYLSLIDHGRSNLALPDGHPFLGINNAQYYWSGTTPMTFSLYAYGLGISSGICWEAQKNLNGYAWPVRGGP